MRIDQTGRGLAPFRNTLTLSEPRVSRPDISIGTLRPGISPVPHASMTPALHAIGDMIVLGLGAAATAGVGSILLSAFGVSLF